MKTILVSGASGIVGYGILKSLKGTGKDYKLIGTTIYQDSVAQGFCDIFEKAPSTDCFNYIDWLINVINKHQVDLLMPGIEADMYKWTDHISEIKNTGAKILLNNPELIALCKDKWIFFEALKMHNLPCLIDSSLNPNFKFLLESFGLPFLLKPRRGFGSKGIVKVKDEIDYAKYKSEVGTILMAQPIVGDDEEEYTTSAFCDGQGGFCASMTLRRKLSKDGFTEKAEVCEINGVSDVLDSLCKIFKPIGPTNFQFRLHAGTLKLLEINPRISSATSIRSAFGYNECQMAVDFFLDNRLPEKPLIKKGRAVRYMEDFIFYENRNNI